MPFVIELISGQPKNIKQTTKVTNKWEILVLWYPEKAELDLELHFAHFMKSVIESIVIVTLKP